MDISLRILIVEDSQDDTELIVRQIRSAGYTLSFQRVQTANEVTAALRKEVWDLIISDYSLPGFSGLAALHLLKGSGLDIPFILISGAIGEETAVEAMKEGANDYLMKSNLTRLIPAIERELRDAEVRAAKRRIENERTVLIERLQEALSARDEFLLVASHELKTPITSLKLHAELMRRIEKQPGLSLQVQMQRQREILENFEIQIDKLTILINKLLDVSRISVGRLILEPVELDLSVLVRKVVEEFRDELTQGQCSIQVQVQTPVFGMWDPFRMEQVLINLLGNAMKYATGASIFVGVEASSDVATITVQDTGPGIAREDQKRIFHRFERGTNHARGEGLGLGLYITSQIIQAHGGTIQVESEAGKGSKFLITLPKTFRN